MKNYYSIEELTAIMYTEEERTPRFSKKYRETREKLADMPQEQFDEYYRAFVGTTGHIGPNVAIDNYELVMFNAIAEWFNNYGKHRGALSVSDIIVEAYTSADKKTRSAINPRVTEVETWYNGTRYSIVESFQARTRKFLLGLAKQGEIEHIEVKTRGKVHLHMFAAKH